jgi:peptidoglycan LD-endopeptidase CwlK
MTGTKFVLGAKSLKNLNGVHPDLVRVIKRAIQLTPVDFSVIEGLRTLARQKELVAAGASKTMNSRHLTGHAVDIAPYVAGKIRWDWPLFHQIAPAVKQAAMELGIPIVWGGDWRTFKDGPHFELERTVYK